ncbi:NUDIX hydrolase [Pseudooceanicola sp.]|uniref:NUDIX hydrolase n=1 Tax=Pseudooceanicola sp. TaxID=1914328 RepID=UPI0040598084
MTDHPRLAALAVVLRGEHVLLVRRRNEPDAGLWGFPGGHVEAGETVGAAAVRELQEETGVKAAPRGTLDTLDIILHDEDGTLRFHFLLVAVLCAHVAGEPVAADDVDDAAWVPVAKVLARALPMSADVDTVVAKARAAAQP